MYQSKALMKLTKICVAEKNLRHILCKNDYFIITLFQHLSMSVILFENYETVYFLIFYNFILKKKLL